VTPPSKPLLLYDGACAFCRLWIARWRHVAGERVDIAPYQEAAGRAPGLTAEQLARAVHLVEPGGRVTRGAEAVFRSLAAAPGHGGWLALYRRLPGFAPASEACYAWVASHRPLCERLTRIVWGPHVVPPGERVTSWIFLRALGVIFLIAFVSLWTQIIGLIGREGILPVAEGLDMLRAASGPERYWRVPTLAWVSASDGALHGFCAAGVALSALLAAGFAPALCLVGSWALYLSLVAVGRDFLSFQWDTLLLETALLAVFLAPLRWWSRPMSDPPPSRLALWALRALLFRLYFSSAVVKLASGDPTWRDLTALTFHYETQCIPPWTAWFMHQLPGWCQRLSAAGMFAIEGLVPFLILAPRRIRFAAAGVMIGLQATIALTGNYGFFNLLSAALCLVLLDDGVWPWRWRGAAAVASAGETRGVAPRPRGRWPGWVLRPAVVTMLLLGLVPAVGALRGPVAWLGPLPVLYHLVAPFRSVNGYGLFSIMTTRRPEIVIEASDDGIAWREIAFRWKAGDLRRRPAFVAPHQPRLDWQMWFAALGDYRNEPWFLAFCERLLQGRRPVWALLGADAPPRPPRYLRALVYDYGFTDAATRRANGTWWRRSLQGLYCPVLTLESGRLAPAPPGVGVR
jgi:predicted DCC family thiol-disulfide oxidoreductase YuxK